MNDPLDLDSLNALDAQALAQRLSEPGEARVTLIRAAAEAGVAEGQALYAQMLLDGREVPADPSAAFHWFNRAAKQEHLLAINMVGRCYELGWGTAIDMVRAAECFRVAALRGLPAGMYNYASRLTLGTGIAQDRPAALEWFRTAAGQTRDPLMAAKSANYIGSFHEDGWVVDRDLGVAEDYYRQAAEGGDFRGQFNYARMCIAAGKVEDALLWLGKVPLNATDAFLVQARIWLERNLTPPLRDRAQAAVAG